MENKLNFVRNGIRTNLPPGFRFQPTDEELVFQYLKCKIFSLPLPASIIPEIINVSQHDPWDLPGDGFEQERYFFSNKEVKYRNGIRTNSGYWKASGVDKKIVSSSTRNHQMVGVRKTLVFHEGKPPNGSRTDWIMHEYRLSVQNHDDFSDQMGNWVLCHVFLRKRSETISVSYVSSSSSCSSSSSSTITIEDLSSSDEETSSSSSYDYLFS